MDDTRIPGLTARPDQADESPLAIMARLMTARPQQGMALVQQARDLLRQATQADPRLTPIVATALKVLQQGTPETEDDDRDGHPEDHMPGPDVASSIPVRTRT